MPPIGRLVNPGQVRRELTYSKESVVAPSLTELDIGFVLFILFFVIFFNIQTRKLTAKLWKWQTDTDTDMNRENEQFSTVWLVLIFPLPSESNEERKKTKVEKGISRDTNIRTSR